MLQSRSIAVEAVDGRKCRRRNFSTTGFTSISSCKFKKTGKRLYMAVVSREANGGIIRARKPIYKANGSSPPEI